jgi:hypothetical protein
MDASRQVKVHAKCSHVYTIILEHVKATRLVSCIIKGEDLSKYTPSHVLLFGVSSALLNREVQLLHTSPCSFFFCGIKRAEIFSFAIGY